IGKLNELEEVDEYRVEMIVKDALIKTAVAALIEAHPYEEPAYSVLKIEQPL
ncbi:MAG: NGG1p interacting factor NIF3, partial [Desulfobacula sp.]|nr:NGG1p interacting factor NIF3 [Desulfobacula sp.]